MFCKKGWIAAPGLRRGRHDDSGFSWAKAQDDWHKKELPNKLTAPEAFTPPSSR
jgi:hypothetical protein